MKTVRRPPYPKWNPGYFPCSSLIPLPLSSRRPSVSFGGFGISPYPLARPPLHQNAVHVEVREEPVGYRERPAVLHRPANVGLAADGQFRVDPDSGLVRYHQRVDPTRWAGGCQISRRLPNQCRFQGRYWRKPWPRRRAKLRSKGRRRGFCRSGRRGNCRGSRRSGRKAYG